MEASKQLTKETFDTIKDIFSKIAFEYIKSIDFSNNKWKEGKTKGKVSSIENLEGGNIVHFSYTYFFHPRNDHDGRKEIKSLGNFCFSYPKTKGEKFIEYNGEVISQYSAEPMDKYFMYKDETIGHQKQFEDPINGGWANGFSPYWVKEMDDLIELEGRELAQRLTNIYNELKGKGLLVNIEVN